MEKTKKVSIDDLPEKGDFMIQLNDGKYSANYYYPDRDRAVRFYNRKKAKAKFFLDNELIDLA